MTVFKQLEVWATGSRLHPTVKKTRIQVSIITLSVLVCTLIIGSGLAVNIFSQRYVRDTIIPRPLMIHTMRRNTPLETQNDDIQEILNQIELYQTRSFITGLIIFDILLFVMLALCTWFGLYWILYPLSDTLYRKESFIRHASHDLRTPLAILHSELTLAQENETRDGIIEIIRDSTIEIERLQALANMYLEYMQSPQSLYAEEHISLYSLITSILHTLEKHYKTSVNVSNNVHTNEKIHTSHTQAISQIIYNCLTNAFENAIPHSTITIAYHKHTLIITNSTHNTHIHEGSGLSVCRSLADIAHVQFAITLKDSICTTTIRFTSR